MDSGIDEPIDTELTRLLYCSFNSIDLTVHGLKALKFFDVGKITTVSNDRSRDLVLHQEYGGMRLVLGFIELNYFLVYLAQFETSVGRLECYKAMWDAKCPFFMFLLLLRMANGLTFWP